MGQAQIISRAAAAAKNNFSVFYTLVFGSLFLIGNVQDFGRLYFLGIFFSHFNLDYNHLLSDRAISVL